jgi:CO/xanthine dehydrogenase FAD-binding subunit
VKAVQRAAEDSRHPWDTPAGAVPAPAPVSLAEALRLRAEGRIPYAGGTDLMVENRKGAEYVFLGRVPELRSITEDETFLRVGAAVTFTEALASPLVPPLMKEALSRIAAPAIRNAGTFGGNLGNGSAKADSVLIAFVADARVRLVSPAGERIIPVEEFYLGRKKLDLHPDELICELLLPKTGLEHYYYQKVGGREALAISRVSFAGVFDTEKGKITRLAAAFGAVADTVVRYRDLEALLIGKTLEEAKALKAEFLAAYAERLVLTRGRVSAEYRKRVCLNLLEDFLTSFGV